jgi:hypothetical protein
MAAEPDVARGEPSVDDLKRQLNEALQHQAATNELLEVIRRSASDFQSVLDALLAAAARLCGVEAGGVAIRDGEVFRYLATVGMNAEFDAVMRGRTLSLLKNPSGHGVALPMKTAPDDVRLSNREFLSCDAGSLHRL